MLDSFKYYGVNVSPSHSMERLHGWRDVKWLGKMASNSLTRNNTKFCTFYSEYNHLIERYRHLMWKVNKLVR